jgi:excisionase family DNA binding protein
MVSRPQAVGAYTMAIGQDAELLTIAEAAQALKVSKVTIHRWLKQGRLTAYRVGPRAVRIGRSELSRLLTPRKGKEVSPMPEILRPPADVVVSPPSQEQIERRLAAISQAKELRAQMRKRRGGAPLPSSWQLIRQAREERARRV